MAHAWKACWVQALGGSNPPSSATGPRDRFRFRGFCCLQPRLISGRRESCPPASRPRRVLLLVVLLVFWAPEGPAALMGRAALCARGRRPAREPSAPRASLGASSRSPARPRHRPPAPQPGPPDPPAPSTPAALVSLGLSRPGPAAAHRHRGQALRALRCPPHRRHLWCCAHRPAIGRLLRCRAPASSP